MEIKRINGVISAYSTARKTAAPRTDKIIAARNTDRVEFGFEKALSAAKNGIAAQVRADAAPQEISSARQLVEDNNAPGDLVAHILFG